jgi:hypothetical protein
MLGHLRPVLLTAMFALTKACIDQMNMMVPNTSTRGCTAGVCQ